MESYHTVIVGAGPAGLKCAEVLAKAGKKVLVLEKDKVLGNKVCAGGLTPKAFHYVDKKLFEREFKGFFLNIGKRRIWIEHETPLICTLSRRKLGEWMGKQAEKAGASILLDSRVKEITGKYVVAGGKKYYYTYLVGADGGNSIVRKYLGLPIREFGQSLQYLVSKKFKNLEVSVDLNKLGPYYMWVFPYAKSATIGSGVDLSGSPGFTPSVMTVKKGLDDKCSKYTKKEFQACVINFDYRGFDFGNIFLTGEAAGLASGLTGEGMYQAIASAEDIAHKILDPKHECKLIEEILIDKRKEERIMRLMEKNKHFTRFLWLLAELALKSKRFRNRLVRHFS